jgi:hypothetical protein
MWLCLRPFLPMTPSAALSMICVAFRQAFHCGAMMQPSLPI